MRQNVWAAKRETRRPGKVDVAEKQAIIVACETFIATVLKPRLLPEIRPTEWNYVVDIHGAWHAGRYRFMQRYRSGNPQSLGQEFDAAFAGIDRMAPDRFDIHWKRHTGTWWRLYTDKTLVEALRIVETDPVLRPV